MKSIIKYFFLLLFVLPLQFNIAQEKENIKIDLVEKQLPFGLVVKEPAAKPVISLVLSGGGARAISHLGVIKAIEELKIPIDYLITTSMGSVIGGLYASGYSLYQLDSMMRTINWEELFFLTGADRQNLFVDQKITEDKALLTVRLDGLSPVVPQSINTGRKISSLLSSITLGSPLNRIRRFDDLLFKYRAVATELVTGERVVLDNGSISEAMRASSSVSFLLPPIKIDSLLLVDGGLVDNLPIKTATEFKADIIIASDATSSLRSRDELTYPWEIADQLVTIPSRKIWTEYIDYADVMIKQNLNGLKNNDFSKIDFAIERGYNEAKSNLNGIFGKLKREYIKKLAAEDKVYSEILLKPNPNEIERKIFKKLSDTKNVSKSEILYELCKLYESGDFEDLSAAIIQDSSARLSVNYKLNRNVNNVKLTGVSQILINKAYSYYSNLYGKPYNAKELLKSNLELLRNYREQGFTLAEINKTTFDKNSGDLTIYIDEGIISDIIITGNEKTLPSIIKREFSGILGKYKIKSNLDEGIKSLSATNLFNDIDIQIERIEKNDNKLKIELSEKLPNVLRLGLRIDNENFTQFALDLRNENLFGTGSELGLSVAGGSRKMAYTVEHKTNRIFNTYLTYKAQAYYKFNDVNQYADDDSDVDEKFSRSRIAEYRQRFYGGFIGIGAHLKKLGIITAEAKYEINEIDNLFNIPSRVEYRQSISSLRFRLQIDSQNKYPYPTSGTYLNTYYETAQKIFGGDVSFAKFSFDYANYFTFAKKHTIKPKIIFGFADETLPLSQQFSFGGQENFLGYREFEFRGRQILIGSIEYRYKIPINIYFETYFKIRYDLGSSWVEQEQIRFRNLKHGLGFTLSFDTPIGPADFSVGRSLYLKDTSPKRILSRGPFMFYFTIGYYY